MRKGCSALLALAMGMPLVASAAGKFTASDYKRALWMATRFYGGQRSGAGPNWLQMETSYPTSFTNDAYNGTDVSGGWFDCGDHAMYGQTQYWAAYTLAQAYDAFPTGFYDLYNGADYSDYKASKNYDMGGGTPNGIPDIIDELVYETDFIAKAAISSSQFVAKKGVGFTDHNLWMTPGYQSAKKTVSEGGASDGSRSITVDQGDGSMACYASATLALMSRILTRLNIYPAKASLYATKAKVAYDYATNHQTTVSVSDGGTYPANSSFKDDYATASLEMYKLTGTSSYLTTATGLTSSFTWGDNGLCYNDNQPQAFYNLYEIGGVSSALTQLTGSSGMMNKYTTNVNSEGVTTIGNSWGALRYAANGAYMGALSNKATKATTYDGFIYAQIDYILGGNSAKQSFLTGFCSGCTAQPKFPHHRGVYLYNDLDWSRFNNTKSSSNWGDTTKILHLPTRNQYHGSLLGGARTSSGFTENIDDATKNEVCTDYNVGLVGALAYIVSELAPADTHKTTGISVEAGHSNALLSFARLDGKTEIRMAGMALVAGDAFDLSGRKVASLEQSGAALSLSTVGLVKGVYLVRVRAADGQSLSRSVAIY